VFDLLVYLVRNRDRVVSKDDLIDRAPSTCRIGSAEFG
jgi:DNA-binding response OmpR family regulator